MKDDFEDEFEKLHREHLLILKALGTLQTTCSLILRREQSIVSPELENQIRLSGGLSTKIDEQVPDQP